MTALIEDRTEEEDIKVKSKPTQRSRRESEESDTA